MALLHNLRTEHGANWDERLCWYEKAEVKAQGDRLRRLRERRHLADLAATWEEDVATDVADDRTPARPWETAAYDREPVPYHA